MIIHSKIIGKALSKLVGEHILLEERGVHLVAHGYDQIYVKIKLDCQCGSNALIVPSSIKSFIDLLDEEIEIIFKEKSLTIKHDNGNTNIPGMAKEQFPKFSGSKKFHEISIDSQVLAQAFRRTQYFTNDGSAMDGVLILCDKDLHIVSTDRITIAEFKVTGDFGQAKGILPAQFMRNLKLNGPIKIGFGESSLYFSTNDTIIMSPVLAGEFPNYRKIHLDYKIKNKVNREDLISSLKRCLIMSPEIWAINFSFGENLIVSSRGLGETKEILTYIGDPIDITLNGKVLLRYLSSIEDEEITMELEKDKPISIYNNGLFLLQPIISA